VSVSARRCERADGTPAFCSICDMRERSICADLSPDEMDRVARTMAHIPLREGDAVLREGELSDSLYILVAGAFRLVRLLADGRRQITGFVFPGDYLGMNSTMKSPNTAEALEPSLVCRFSHAFLDEASVRNPHIKDLLIRRGQSDLEKAQDHIVLLGKQNAEERVTSFLAMLARYQARGGAPARDVYLPMSRQDVADYLGLRLETLSRTLGVLKKDGRLAAVSGRIVALGPQFETGEARARL